MIYGQLLDNILLAIIDKNSFVIVPNLQAEKPCVALVSIC